MDLLGLAPGHRVKGGEVGGEDKDYLVTKVRQVRVNKGGQERIYIRHSRRCHFILFHSNHDKVFVVDDRLKLKFLKNFLCLWVNWKFKILFTGSVKCIDSQ